MELSWAVDLRRKNLTQLNKYILSCVGGGDLVVFSVEDIFTP